MGGRIRFALERSGPPRHRSHVAQLFLLGHLARMARNRTVWIVLAAVVLLAVASMIAFLSPAVPQRKLDKLTLSMSQQDAERLLGRPVESFTWNDGTTVLRYTSAFHLGYVDVFFKSDGRYRYYNYERF